MSRVDHGPVIQGQEFVFDGGDDLPVVAAPEIGASDAAVKQSVPGEELIAVGLFQ